MLPQITRVGAMNRVYRGAEPADSTPYLIREQQ